MTFTEITEVEYIVHWPDLLMKQSETFCGVKLHHLGKGEYTIDWNNVTCPGCMGALDMWDDMPTPVQIQIMSRFVFDMEMSNVD